MASLKSETTATYTAPSAATNNQWRRERVIKTPKKYQHASMPANINASNREDGKSLGVRKHKPRRKRKLRKHSLLGMPRDSSQFAFAGDGSEEVIDPSSASQPSIIADPIDYALAHNSTQTTAELLSPSLQTSKIYVILHQQLDPANDDFRAIDYNYSVETVAAFSTLDKANRQAWIVALERHPEFGLPGHIRPRSDEDDTELGKYLEWFQEEDGTLELWCCATETAVDYKVWVSEVVVDEEA